MEKQHTYAAVVELSDLFLFRFQKTLERGKHQDMMTQKKKKKSMKGTDKCYEANVLMLVLSTSS